MLESRRHALTEAFEMYSRYNLQPSRTVAIRVHEALQKLDIEHAHLEVDDLADQPESLERDKIFEDIAKLAEAMTLREIVHEYGGNDRIMNGLDELEDHKVAELNLLAYLRDNI